MSSYNENERIPEGVFRFKESAVPTSDRDRDRDSGGHRRRRRHHHRQHGSHKRRKLSNDYSLSTSSLPPDVAFRESLFDALGDDEGADFWQGVYGQPIHTYSRTYEDADTGELGTMDDEQYAAYVRRRMWEKSAEGLAAAREAKHKERKEQEQNRRRTEAEPKSEAQGSTTPDFPFDLEIDASLKRGQQRKDRRRWQQIWQAYLDRWKELQNIHDSRREHTADDAEQIFLRNKIAWPVESGQRGNINTEEVTRFFDNVSVVQEAQEDAAQVKASILKAERIRWHPDKIQQRYGFLTVDQDTKESVTAVFQIVDNLWNNLRVSSSHK